MMKIALGILIAICLSVGILYLVKNLPDLLTTFEELYGTYISGLESPIPNS